MLAARQYRNRPSKHVILSIGSRREGNACHLPTKKSLDTRIRPCAGTRSPAERSTTSPGTRSRAGTIVCCPSRKTCSLSATDALRRSAAPSARCSCTVSSTALISTMGGNNDKAGEIVCERGDQRRREQDEYQRVAKPAQKSSVSGRCRRSSSVLGHQPTSKLFH